MGCARGKVGPGWHRPRHRRQWSESCGRGTRTCASAARHKETREESSRSSSCSEILDGPKSDGQRGKQLGVGVGWRGIDSKRLGTAYGVGMQFIKNGCR